MAHVPSPGADEAPEALAADATDRGGCGMGPVCGAGGLWNCEAAAALLYMPGGRMCDMPAGGMFM